MAYSTGHTIYINKYGIEVPSVTTILKILNKPALLKWANYLGFKRQNVNDELERTSTIGTQVHRAIEAYLMQRYYIFVGCRLCTRTTMALYLNSFFDWLKKHKEIKPIFMEKKLISERYGGTVDFYGMVDGKATILDFKTSKTFYSSMFLQLAAYCIMLEEQGYPVEQVGIIIINNKGYDEKFISREILEKYIRVYKLLVELFHGWYDLNIDQGWGDILSK